jgi:dihydroorotase
MQRLISNARLLDPGNIDQVGDLLIKHGKIAAIGSVENGLYPADRKQIIDAQGWVVVPGLIDMHVHFREPGQTHKETIETGCLSAARGGVTSVCTMPNTTPANDSVTVTRFIMEAAAKVCGARLYPVAAISKGLEGRRLCDFEALKQSGAIAVSDDGLPVKNSQFMREALEAAGKAGLLVISHSEDMELARRSGVNEGPISRRMGLSGNPNASESIMVMRDIALSELTGCPIHIAHVSTRESVRAIREAKQRGIRVTAETAPHYFTLTDEAIDRYGTNAKMNPPLRSHLDREAIRNALADGTIDVIATDHAPHAEFEKKLPFADAPNGIIGLETSLPISLKLVKAGVISLTTLIEKMSINPARILGIESGLKIGHVADLTLIDLKKRDRLDATEFRSLSRNSPFDQWDVEGNAVMTIIGGEIVYS